MLLVNKIQLTQWQRKKSAFLKFHTAVAIQKKSWDECTGKKNTKIMIEECTSKLIQEFQNSNVY
jgi:hypothetical protein